MSGKTSKNDFALRKLLFTASVLPIVLLLIVAGALVWQIQRLENLSAWIDHTDVVISRANALAFGFAERENGLRGYLLTGKEQFLKPYLDAQRELVPALADLERLVGDNPLQLTRMKRIRELNVSWSQRSQLAPGVSRDRGRGADFSDAALLEGMNARKIMLDELRRVVRQFTDEEERLRGERSLRARQGARDVIIETVALVVAFGGIIAFWGRRQLRNVANTYVGSLRQADDRARLLAESEERFRLFVEGVRDAAIYMLDPEGRVRSWNAGAERIKGYRPEEVIGRHASIFYTPEDVEADVPQSELREAAERGQIENENWRVRKGGARFWGEVMLRALRGGDGRIVGYAKLVHDTTERKRAEMRRVAQYGVVRVLSETASLQAMSSQILAELGSVLGYAVGIVWAPGEGGLHVVADWAHPEMAREDEFIRYVKTLSIARGEGFAGRVWSTGSPLWVKDLHEEEPSPHVVTALEFGLSSMMLFPVKRGPELELVLHFFATDPRPQDEDLLRLTEVLGVQIGTFMGRLRAEQEERELERKRSEELERRVEERTVELTAVNRELEAFSYSVSHDLRAPLRAMDGFSQVLLEDYVDRIDATGRDYLARIRAASQRMSQLIDDLIQLSRVTRVELRREDVNLSALFSEVVAEVKAREPARQVEVRIEENVCARGDAHLLRAGLVNLVSNAFKFTRKQVDARIDFGVTGGSEGRVYHVRDNGAGFEMAYVSKLFQPFQRLHASSEFEGTGIGLATWQRIVRRHGGRVWAEGAPGKGATFYFTLGDF